MRKKDSGGVINELVIEPSGLDVLIQELRKEGYHVIGPRLGTNSITLGEVTSATELPCGWRDEQKKASYRLKRRQDEKVFGFVLGPHSWKKYLHPPYIRLWTAERSQNKVEFITEESDFPRYAFLGVRPCEVAAISIQDRVLLKDEFVDRVYEARRRDVFLVAVNCTEPGGTCFCQSMGAGPGIEEGYDLAMTEVCQDGQHFFLVSVGSDRARTLMGRVPHIAALEKQVKLAKSLVGAASRQMGRSLDREGVRDLLVENTGHCRWEETGKRCLTCGNCTMVCPTCFCVSVEDVTDLEGSRSERWRRWDSCFTLEFSYIHGVSHRSSGRTRYRHWLTHKLATWQDQFGMSGCVGCGRCITWCPASIDLTEEIQAIRDSDVASRAS